MSPRVLRRTAIVGLVVAVVGIASPVQGVGGPPPVISTQAAACGPIDRSYVHCQGYLTSAGGVDAEAVKEVPGALGEFVLVADVEYEWNHGHEDLSAAAPPEVRITNLTPAPSYSDDHGTAVLGVLAADHNTFGVNGLVPGAELRTVNVYTTMGPKIADAVRVARERLGRGDVLLIEQQVLGRYKVLVPPEYLKAVYDEIVAATAAGIIVVEPAGDGLVFPTPVEVPEQDLDNRAYVQPFPGGRADSGAIIVGAGSAPNCGPEPAGSRARFTTYGADNVHLQGWGECVTTTGYGQRFPRVGDKNKLYALDFGGTSSAAAIVAGVAASVSSAHQAAHQTDGVPPLTSQQMRDLLVRTGSPQVTSQPGALPGLVGPLPNLREAFRELGLLG